MPELTSNTLSESAHQKANSHITSISHDEIKAHHAITIGKAPEEVFRFWRNFENLALFMKDVQRVEVLSAKRSRWLVQLKSGAKASWEADILNEKEGQMISWASVEGSEVETTGIVWFEKAQGNRGTVVRMAMDYKIPGGKLAEIITMFMGEDPKNLVETNLKRLKAFLETGEIPTTEGQPSGREEISEPTLRH